MTAVRLGRVFIRPICVDGEGQEPGEPEAVVPDAEGQVAVGEAAVICGERRRTS